MNKYLRMCSILLLAISVTSCDGSASNKEVEIHSLSDGLKYLNTKKNYTLKYFSNTTDSDACYLMFDSKSIGFKVDSNPNRQYHLIQDKGGIYPLTYDEGYVSGEYLKDSDNQLYKSLWNNTIYTTLLGVETDYVNSISSSISELVITNKKYKMAFIETLGYTSTDYTNVDYIKCLFEDNTLKFELKILNSKAITYTLENLNTTTNNDVETYKKNGGSVFIPGKELQGLRRLIRTNNFTRDIYDVIEKTFVGCEIFTEDYFYSELYGSNSGSGSMEMVQAANADHKFDLYGCYNFNTVGSVQTAVTNITFYPVASYETPDITLMYHYPSYLKILDNLQLLKKGHLEDAGYTPTGESYITYDNYYIYDFIYNFSFENSYDPSTFIPYALEIDIDLKETDEESLITFVYYFTYSSSLYSVIVPLRDFNCSNIALLDVMHTRLNG